MPKFTVYILTLFLLTLLPEFSLSGQEILGPSRIQARGVRRNLPYLGLPVRISGEIDPTIWYKDGCWHGADSLKASPFWITETIDIESVVKTKMPAEIVDFCKENKPDMAVLCLPADKAPDMVDTLVNCGIRSFWNFSHYDIHRKYPELNVANVHLSDSLMTLSFIINNNETGELK